MCHVLSLSNQKGGVSKSTTCVNLGIGLARLGKKVLLIDADSQGSLTLSLGYQPNELSVTLSVVMDRIMDDVPFDTSAGILHHHEGVDLMPCNKQLAGTEVLLVNAISRESVLRQYVDTVRHLYDYILIDCPPTLGMIVTNALVAADGVIIPVQPQYLSVSGMTELLQTVTKIRKKINPQLKVEGILLTLVDIRTNYAKDIITLIKDNFEGKLRIFENLIPYSVRAAETSAEGKSIFLHAPDSKVAKAYEGLTLEVVGL